MTTPYYQDERVTLYLGDCLDVLRDLPDASVDAVVCDPPYGLEFMGKEWDAFKPSSARLRTRIDGRTNPAEGKSVTTTPEAYVAGHPFQLWCEQWAAECLRVLKPGGHLLAFGGTRTWHRLACAIEDAGFEIRDTITWLYGSGFPKSLDVGKAIDKAAGAKRPVVGQRDRLDQQVKPAHGFTYAESGAMRDQVDALDITAPATEDAARWDGWGTALKPASEPIVVARKPLAGTVAANVLTHGTGALNIAATRVATIPTDDIHAKNPHTIGGFGHAGATVYATSERTAPTYDPTRGRWPSNVVLTHAPDCEHEDDGGCAEGCPIAELDAQSGTLTSGANPTRRGTDKFRDAYGDFKGQEDCTPARGADTGGASRFFPAFRYEAKADATERPRAGDTAHPTVKPLALMRWLVRLITPPGGVVLDPFAGSGTTAEACIIEGFRCVTIEREAEYLPLILHRITRRTNPVAHLAAQAERGEDVDLGLFGLLDDLGGVA